MGVACLGALGELEMDGKKLVFLNGEDPRTLKRLIDEQQYDFVVHGHAPVTEDRTSARLFDITSGKMKLVVILDDTVAHEGSPRDTKKARFGQTFNTGRSGLAIVDQKLNWSMVRGRITVPA